MDLRELRAFATVAQELHFARAADRLYMSPSSMSELIHRLELELGAPLFARTTRRVELTDAGAELFPRAEAILDLVDQAAAATAAVARGNVGHIRLGITPPAHPVLAPHLARQFMTARPNVSVHIQQMWLPQLGSALVAGTVDAAITCGAPEIDTPHIKTAEIGSERVLIGLRAGHPLADRASVDLQQLAEQTLGMHPAHLFPAWHAVQQQILSELGLSPPMVELDEADLTARRWTEQPDVDWIMLIASFLAGQDQTVVRPTTTLHTIPFTISWQAQPTTRPIVQRFVQSTLDAALPDGWIPPSRRDKPS